MGCLSSKELIDDNQPNQNIQITVNNIQQEQPEDVPPIVITKTQSIASVESDPSTSAKATQVEKVSITTQEQPQEHQLDAPPMDLNNFKQQENNIETLPVKPLVLMNSNTIVPETDLPKVKKDAEEAGILPATSTSSSSFDGISTSDFSITVRFSNGKDFKVQLPTSEPYMTIKQLKTHLEQNKVKFIHLGRILQDDFVLVPANSPSSNLNIVKISNGGVIQAMVLVN